MADSNSTNSPPPPYTRNMNIIIVGGSLCGLFTGVALKRLNQGHNIRILERHGSFLQDFGAGLVNGGPAGDFFARYDSTNTPVAAESPFRQYLNRAGEQISKEDWVQRMTSWNLMYNVLRWNYDGVSEEGYPCRARGAAPPDPDVAVDTPATTPAQTSVTYSYGCTVTAIHETPGADHPMAVTFTDAAGTPQTAAADLVLGTDGPSSTIRRLVDPAVTRDYVGYVLWRGTLPEEPLTARTADTLVEKFTFFHAKGMQVLAYIMPGDKGALDRGARRINWGWYCNYPEGSAEHAALMTDAEGVRHRFTLSPGMVDARVWEGQLRVAREVLPPQLCEIVERTERPFVQAITDVIASRNCFFGGRVLLLGDACAGFRPHTASGSSQAALDAMLLADVFQGKMNLQEWEEQTMKYARETQQRGVKMGNRSQFEDHPLAC